MPARNGIVTHDIATAEKQIAERNGRLGRLDRRRALRVGMGDRRPSMTISRLWQSPAHDRMAAPICAASCRLHRACMLRPAAR